MTDRIRFRVSPMLPTLVHQPLEKPGWIYEEKYDGYRILAYKEGARVTLVSRNGIDRTANYPGVAQAVAKLPRRTILLDTEVVVFDEKRVSRFQLLQNVRAEPKAAVFDCLYLDGRDLRRLPLEKRRAAVHEIIKDGVLFESHLLAEDGLEAYKIARRRGFEGVVAKDLSSPYIEGRSTRWLKFKVHQEDEFVIAGYTAPGGSREHFGALLLGAHDRGKLRYAGKVGTGFTRKTLAALWRKFQPLIREKSPLADPPREKSVTWLEPQLVAQIAYQEWTDDHKLRQPVFLGLRDDKPARDVTFPG
ncbi:MAG TPA: non-homologous end-joining DNA ligase [Bryobacteraceae bacterium]|nr:non-homologous end-joining DNA ligase [Bryobacteraceae bacterium]